jgi:hypothetical protein
MRQCIKKIKTKKLSIMTLVKEFSELHISLKTILISLTLIMPFWYISIFILNRNFVNSTQIHIPIILSFCLTFCYFILNLATTYLYDYLDKIGKQKENNPDIIKDLFSISSITTLLSIFWISILLFIGYYYDWNIISFIKIVFLISFIHLVLFCLTIMTKEIRIIGKQNKNNK